MTIKFKIEYEGVKKEIEGSSLEEAIQTYHYNNYEGLRYEGFGAGIFVDTEKKLEYWHFIKFNSEDGPRVSLIKYNSIYRKENKSRNRWDKIVKKLEVDIDFLKSWID